MDLFKHNDQLYAAVTLVGEFVFAMKAFLTISEETKEELVQLPVGAELYGFPTTLVQQLIAEYKKPIEETPSLELSPDLEEKPLDKIE